MRQMLLARRLVLRQHQSRTQHQHQHQHQQQHQRGGPSSLQAAASRAGGGAPAPSSPVLLVPLPSATTTLPRTMSSNAAGAAGKRRRRMEGGSNGLAAAGSFGGGGAANGGGESASAAAASAAAAEAAGTPPLYGAEAVPRPSPSPEFAVPDGCVHAASYLRSVRAVNRVPGLQVTDHVFRVPLDHHAAAQQQAAAAQAQAAAAQAAAAGGNAAAAPPPPPPPPEIQMIEIFARELSLPILGPGSGREFPPVPTQPPAAPISTAGETPDPARAPPCRDAAAAEGAAAAAAASAQPPPPHTPYLLYLQGGPGFESPRPTDAGGWVKAALSQGFRVLLLDQRGTGRSTPVTLRALAAVGGDSAQADYLRHFRADSIVRDAECVRLALSPSGALRWTLLGQSFGGFCAVSYLSLPDARRALNEVLLTGGLPPRVHQACCADEVYRRLYRRVLLQNDKFYARFPADEALVRRCVLALAAHDGGRGPLLPSGVRLSPRAFQLLGLSGLGSGGGFERLHYLLESFFEGGTGAGGGGGGAAAVGAAGAATTTTTMTATAAAADGKAPAYGPSAAFVKAFESWMPWDVNPLYILLHEPIYSQRPPPLSPALSAALAAGALPPQLPAAAGDPAPRWAADRVRREAEFSDAFDAPARARRGARVNFTGEMVFPWMLEDFAALRPVALAAARLAADGALWARSPPLYDPSRLARNPVPVAAASYVEDMYVDFDLAQETASLIRGCRVWATSEYRHSGIRDDGARILDRLLAMARGASLLE